MSVNAFKACSLKAVILVFMAICGFSGAVAQKQKNDSVYYVYRNTGEGIYAVPDSLVKEYKQTGYKINFTLVNDSLISFSKIDVDSVSRIPLEFPKFTSFKINNKYNYDLDNDVYCVINGNNISGDMGYMIGKDLRPSFETDKPAFVYVDTVLQQTRVSRVRFDKEVVYTVKDDTPGVTLDRVLVKSVYEPDSIVEIPLKANMLSTNAPTTSSHTLDKVVDNDPGTFFHCTSSSDAPTYQVLPLDSCVYIDIKLSTYKRKFAFYYMTRPDTDTRQPLAFKVYVQKSNVWEPIDSFDVSDGIPATGASATFMSPFMDAGRNIRNIRIECTQSNYKNYLCLAELKLYEPADKNERPVDYYQYFERPFGRQYKVNLSFRADKAAVPRLDIEVEGGLSITSRDYWLNAKFTLNGNGMYESVEDNIQIKGRGNSSWGQRKKPFTIKFAEKTKLCGLKKGKRWNLMANAQDVTEMMNAVIFKAGRMLSAPYQPHSVPLELYMNGQYMGCYALTEHIGIHNNCVDEDDFSLMIELDDYYDEPVGQKFKSPHYNLPVNIKNPEFTEPGCPITLEEVRGDWEVFEKALKLNRDITPYVNVDTFAIFMFMNDLSGNAELNHPKSTFLYKPTGTDKYIWGPGWDFDWGFGYQMYGSYFRSHSFKTIGVMNGEGKTFFGDMMTDEDVIEAYYKVWVKFVENDGVNELINWMDDYYAFAEPSYAHSAEVGWLNTSYATYFDTFKTWIRNRVDYLYSNLTVPTGIYDDISADWDDKGDKNNGIKVTVERGMLTVESETDTILNIYRVDGTVAGEIEVGTGRNIYPLAPRGVIIVNGQKLYLKPVR